MHGKLKAQIEAEIIEFRLIRIYFTIIYKNNEKKKLKIATYHLCNCYVAFEWENHFLNTFYIAKKIVRVHYHMNGTI